VCISNYDLYKQTVLPNVVYISLTISSVHWYFPVKSLLWNWTTLIASEYKSLVVLAGVTITHIFSIDYYLDDLVIFVA